MSDHSDDNAVPDQASPEDGPKGQKMVIYMPQGAVIIERIDVDQHGDPVDVNAERMNADEVSSSASVSGERPNSEEHKLLLRVAEILDDITGRTAVKENGPVPVVTTARENYEEHQLLFRIAEILDGITKRIYSSQDGHQLQTRLLPANAEGAAFATTSFTSEPYHEENEEEPKRHRIDWTKERHIHWMHLINIAFVLYIALTAVIPQVLSAYFDTSVYVANSDSPGAMIYRGDLLVSKSMPISTLHVNDVVLLRNERTWNLEVRQVLNISASSGAGLTTITTKSVSGAANPDSYTLVGATQIHKLTSVISRIGDLSTVLTSVTAKLVVYLSLLMLNIIVHIRKGRRRANRK